ncbi:MAG: GAF domain-containing sensor histidine kinase [Variovorax sp.]|nr:MAG: GAF domain-containing sensor histidine kinase [Variovorax sp.]
MTTVQDNDEAIAKDIAAVGRISAIPALLKLVCQNTGMGFAAVARVSETSWTACAVQDEIAFGLLPGGQLPIETTLCRESRAALEPVVIDHASKDSRYRNHHTPRTYNIESYISVPIVYSNGEYFGNLCAIDPKPARVSDVRIVAMFTAFADLIARQLENEALQVSMETALTSERAAAELREQFIAVLGHDLRNPLAAVGAAAELLRRRPEAEVARIGERVRTSTRRMSRLIDDVLDFARGRLGSGIGVAIRETDRLSASLGDVVAELREAHPDRDIQTDLQLAGTLRCDPDRIQQLVSNLLANALTYGDAKAPVVLEARVVADMLSLSVINSGDPISPGDLARIFEPYWRPASSQPGGGLGLGLHICSQIAKAHGGALTCSSSADAGTRFTAMLPIG